MSSNAKDKTAEGADKRAQATPQATPAAGDGAAVAVVQPAPASAPTPAPEAATAPQPVLDDHHGMGGLYTVIGGERRLVERTGDTPATTQPTPPTATQEQQ